jgi:uncharacterized linocin/CFP29 family protein
MNDYLTREDAPISEEAWKALDTTMTEAARSVLTGRRLLHIEGPYGLGMKSISVGDPGAKKGMVIGCSLPLALIQRSFTIAKRDFAALQSGAAMLDIGPAAQAALECARAEDDVIFNGAPGITGLLNAKGSAGQKLSAWDEVGTAADDIIKAVTTMDNAGFHGPYVLALAPARYNLLMRRYPTGNASELEHIRSIVTEGVVKAPVLGGRRPAAGVRQAVCDHRHRAGYGGGLHRPGRREPGVHRLGEPGALHTGCPGTLRAERIKTERDLLQETRGQRHTALPLTHWPIMARFTSLSDRRSSPSTSRRTCP